MPDKEAPSSSQHGQVPGDSNDQNLSPPQSETPQNAAPQNPNPLQTQPPRNTHPPAPSHQALILPDTRTRSSPPPSLATRHSAMENETLQFPPRLRRSVRSDPADTELNYHADVHGRERATLPGFGSASQLDLDDIRDRRRRGAGDSRRRCRQDRRHDLRQAMREYRPTPSEVHYMPVFDPSSGGESQEERDGGGNGK
ncbi:hypothetical protein FE257_009701 [Aspergillus nanangensis]|uniref:Uncharacterized protein n=1 Tax=Aspergillus nanangensis TaxID=2582783 RepID=A0AAD4CL44_ASPNN|nr:hypothetical protein FE257_009701 [Aspergillus nanangensis]